MNSKKLKGYSFSIFSKNFIEEELEEDTSFFNPFHIIFSLFVGLVISLFVYKLLVFSSVNINKGFYTYSTIFFFTATFFICKWFIEAVLVALFQINRSVHFFLVSKFSYLYSISFLLFFGIVLAQYSQLNFKLLLYFSVLLFLFRFTLHFFANKKLIFSKLFYFILYFCAFEIAPLLILFKLMF